MKVQHNSTGLPNLAVQTALRAGLNCKTYNAPDGGYWDNCKSQCEDDNACRLGYESPAVAYAFLADRQKFIDNSYTCINYWCRGIRHYNKNSNYWRYEDQVTPSRKW